MPDPTKQNIENVLALHANDAMSKGADPQAATEMLRQMIAHLRAHPDVAQQANDALNQGADPTAVTSKMWELAQQGAPPTQAAVAPVEEPATGIRGATSALINGASMGWEGKIGGALNAAFDPSSYTQGKFGANYTEGRRRVDQVNSDFSQAHPVQSLAYNVAGGVLPILATGGAAGPEEGASLLSRIAASVPAQGAKYGAIAGAGSADQGVLDTVTGAIKGAVKGAIAAPIVSGLGSLAGTMGKAIGVPRALSAGAGALADVLPAGRGADALRSFAGSIGPQGQASRQIGQAIQDQGMTPQQIAQTAIARARMSGEKPEIPADYGSELYGLTKRVVKQPGPGRSQITQTLADRAAGTRGREIADVGSGTAPESAAPSFEQAVRDREASANQLFPAAYAAGSQGIDAPGMSELLSRPTFAKAFQRAQTMAADEGIKLPTRTETSTVLTKDGQDLVAQAKPEHQAVLQAKLMEVPGMAETKTKEVPIPDVRTIHYVDRAIRRMADEGFQGNGPINDPQHAKVLMDALGHERDIVASQVPEFGNALQDYAERSKPIEAMVTGKNILKYAKNDQVPSQALGAGDPQALAASRTGIDGLEAAVHNMAEPERQVFRQAAQAAVVDAANKIPATAGESTAPVTRQIFGDSPAAARWERLLFSNQREAGDFQNALDRERTMARTNNMTGGSDTFENAANAAIGAKPSNILTAALHPRLALGQALNAGSSASDAATRAALGGRLSASGSKGIASTMSQLEREAAMRRILQSVGNLGRNSLTARATR